MFVSHVALVSQTKSVKFGQLAIATAALQKQVTRDFSPIWKIEADIAAFEKLEDAPLGYWKIIIRDDIHLDAQGIHLNRANGQPYALVQFSSNWALTTSHECLEMLADPSGNRTQAGDSVKPDQGRVDYLFMPISVLTARRACLNRLSRPRLGRRFLTCFRTLASDTYNSEATI